MRTKILYSIIFLAFVCPSFADEGAELKFTGKIQYIEYECGHDGLCAMIIDDTLVEYGVVSYRAPSHQVLWPGPYRNGEYSKYVGKQAEVYCITRPSWENQKFYLYYIEKWHLKNICSISSNLKYFIKVEGYESNTHNKALKAQPSAAGDAASGAP